MMMRTFTRKRLPGDPTDPESLTAMLERYLLWLETHHFAALTVYVRRVTQARFLLWCHERSITKARQVTPEMLERYQRHLFYYRKRDGGRLSISSQAHWLTALRSWFAWMERERLIEHDPACRLQLPKEEKRLPRHALSQQEVEAVLAQADLSCPFGLRNRAILETLYSTGLRRAEAAALQLSDVDRQRSVVLVRCGKGNKDRFVPIGARALAWIDKYLAEVRPQHLKDPTMLTLFLSKNGRRLHPNQLSAIVRDYLESAGIDKQGACHLLRHSAATLMLEGGADVRYIQAMLGHVSLATTQIYTHVTITKLRQVHRQTHPARLYRTSPEPPPSPSSEDENKSDNPDDSDDDPDAAASVV